MADIQKPSVWGTLKFFGVAGVGFFADGYLRQSIALVITCLGYIYFKDHANAVPTLKASTMKATLNIGMIMGQLTFGVLGDIVGRRRVYGKELMFTIGGTLMCILLPWRVLSQDGVVAWISVWRLVAGFGVGGDYPTSIILGAEKPLFVSRAKISGMLRLCVALGGVGAYTTFVILISAFGDAVQNDVRNLEWVWRLYMGIGIIPCVLTVYSRLRMRETEAYKKYVEEAEAKAEKRRSFREQLHDFRVYFRDWRHGRALFSVCAVWFMYNTISYGISLNTPTILSDIGFATSSTVAEKLQKTGLGNLLVEAAGDFPGYIVSIFLPDLIGRRKQQFFGAALAAIMFAIWAGIAKSGSVGGQITLLTLSQLIGQSGPSYTSYAVPVELFPTRLRSTSYGLAAVCGQCGGILTAYAFPLFTEAAGIPGVMGFCAGLLVLICLATFLIPEPKGATLEDIENDNLFRKKRGHSGANDDVEEPATPVGEDEVVHMRVTADKSVDA